MKCSICETDYRYHKGQWRYNYNGQFIVQSDVFTADILRAILNFAMYQNIEELTIDTSQPGNTTCEGCVLLNIREKKSLNLALKKPPYLHLQYKEFL